MHATHGFHTTIHGDYPCIALEHFVSLLDTFPVICVELLAIQCKHLAVHVEQRIASSAFHKANAIRRKTDRIFEMQNGQLLGVEWLRCIFVGMLGGCEVLLEVNRAAVVCFSLVAHLDWKDNRYKERNGYV